MKIFCFFCFSLLTHHQIGGIIITTRGHSPGGK
nr:MAG TPA: hypothetical protein [Caudoviricetes sp.]